MEIDTQISPRFNDNNAKTAKYNSKGLYSQASNNKIDAITERKEVSKRQAKERRDRERAEFEQLMTLLPNDCPNEKNYNLQLALGYILVRSVFKNKDESGFESGNKSGNTSGNKFENQKQNQVSNTGIPVSISENASGRLKHSLGLIKAGLNGFIIGFITKGTCAGRICYISENVVNYLGYESRYIQGRYIWDLMHHSDVDILAEDLGFEDRFIWDADIEDWRLKDCNNNTEKMPGKKAGSRASKVNAVPKREFLPATPSDKFRLNSIRFHKKKSVSTTDSPEKQTTIPPEAMLNSDLTKFEMNLKHPDLKFAPPLKSQHSLKSPLEHKPPKSGNLGNIKPNTLIVPGSDNSNQHPSPFYTRTYSVMNLSGKSFYFKNDMISSTVHLAVCTEVADRESLKNCDIVLPRSTSQYSKLENTQDMHQTNIQETSSHLTPAHQISANHQTLPNHHQTSPNLNSQPPTHQTPDCNHRTSVFSSTPGNINSTPCIPGAFLVQTDLKFNIVDLKQPTDFMNVKQPKLQKTGNLYTYVDPRSLSQFKHFHKTLIRTSKTKTSYPMLFKTPLNSNSGQSSATRYSITGFVVKLEEKPEFSKTSLIKSEKPEKSEKLQKSKISSFLSKDSCFYLVFSENSSGSVSGGNTVTKTLPKLRHHSSTIYESHELQKNMSQVDEFRAHTAPTTTQDFHSFIPPTPQVQTELVTKLASGCHSTGNKNTSNEAVIGTSSNQMDICSKTDSGSGVKREAVYRVMPLENANQNEQNIQNSQNIRNSQNIQNSENVQNSQNFRNGIGFDRQSGVNSAQHVQVKREFLENRVRQENDPRMMNSLSDSRNLLQPGEISSQIPRIDIQHTMPKRSRPSIEDVVNSNLVNNNFKDLYSGYSGTPASLIFQQQLAIQLAKSHIQNSAMQNGALQNNALQNAHINQLSQNQLSQNLSSQISQNSQLIQSNTMNQNFRQNFQNQHNIQQVQPSFQTNNQIHQNITQINQQNTPQNTKQNPLHPQNMQLLNTQNSQETINTTPQINYQIIRNPLSIQPNQSTMAYQDGNLNLRPTIPSPASTTTINILSTSNTTTLPPAMRSSTIYSHHPGIADHRSQQPSNMHQTGENNMNPAASNFNILPPPIRNITIQNIPVQNENDQHNLTPKNENIQDSQNSSDLTVQHLNPPTSCFLTQQTNIQENNAPKNLPNHLPNHLTNHLPNHLPNHLQNHLPNHLPTQPIKHITAPVAQTPTFYNNLSLQLSKLDSLNQTPTRVITINAAGEQRQHTPSGTDETDDCRPVTEPAPQEKIQWKSSNSENEQKPFHQGTARVNCGYGFEALTPESAMCDGPLIDAAAKCITVPRIDPNAPVEVAPVLNEERNLTRVSTYAKMPTLVVEKMRAYRESKRSSGAELNGYLNRSVEAHNNYLDPHETSYQNLSVGHSPLTNRFDLSSGLLTTDHLTSNYLDHGMANFSPKRSPLENFQKSPMQIPYNHQLSAFKPTKTDRTCDTGPVNISLDHRQIYKMEILDSLRHGEIEIQAQRRLSETDQNHGTNQVSAADIGSQNRNVSDLLYPVDNSCYVNNSVQSAAPKIASLESNLPRQVRLQIERRKLQNAENLNNAQQQLSQQQLSRYHPSMRNNKHIDEDEDIYS